MSEFIISVGIATRNREYYAEQTIRNTYEISDNIQVVVSDNSDSNSLQEKLHDIIDGNRLIYNYFGNKLSVPDNYNNTVEYATGEYYIAIGDDDIVLPNIVDFALFMKANSIDALRTSRKLNYRWPSSNKKGRLLVGPFSEYCHMFDPEKGVITILQNGCQGYLHTDMAGSYHAITSMDCMRRVKKQTGIYFGGVSPDIYSAVCLSLLKNIRCAYIDFPVSLPGWCDKSDSYLANKHKAVFPIEEALKMYSEPEYEWSNLVPYYYTPESTWAESAIKALIAMGREDLIKLYYNRKILVKIIYDRWNDGYKEEMDKYLSSDDLIIAHSNFRYDNANRPRSKMSFLHRKVDVINSYIFKDHRRYIGVNDNYEAQVIMAKYIGRRREKNIMRTILKGEWL